jgi:hypothetical protein
VWRGGTPQGAGAERQGREKGGAWVLEARVWGDQNRFPDGAMREDGRPGKTSRKRIGMCNGENGNKEMFFLVYEPHIFELLRCQA